MRAKIYIALYAKGHQPSQTCSGGFINARLLAICWCFFEITEHYLIQSNRLLDATVAMSLRCYVRSTLTYTHSPLGGANKNGILGGVSSDREASTGSQIIIRWWEQKVEELPFDFVEISRTSRVISPSSAHQAGKEEEDTVVQSVSTVL